MTFTQEQVTQIIEDMHDEVFNCFHHYRKKRTEDTEITLNGKQVNEIIVMAKKRIKRENNLYKNK